MRAAAILIAIALAGCATIAPAPRPVEKAPEASATCAGGDPLAKYFPGGWSRAQ